MIVLQTGDLLNAPAQALVNTVNTVGVMGKGIALQFKKRFPDNFKKYEEACKTGALRIGKVLVVETGDLYQKQFVINFPTKKHWKADSEYSYIESGLQALRQALEDYQIESVAIPPLGCGNGGLNWTIVKPMIEKALANSPATIYLYEPNEQIKTALQQQATPANERKLTPARAMLLYLLYAYEGAGEQASLFVANKLAYFLQRSGEPLRLHFEAHHYGPYTAQLNHVLLYLNGSYLKGLEQNNTKPFEPVQLNYERMEEVKSYAETQLSAEQLERLHSVLQLIHGFESSYALELLASVDYLMHHQNRHSLPQLHEGLQSWSTRKARMFGERDVKLAEERLGSVIGFAKL